MALIHVVNENWATINVQAKLGNNANCEDNADFDQKTISPQGASWDIETNGMDLCVRRDLDPNQPDGQFGDWIRQSDLGDPEYTINL